MNARCHQPFFGGEAGSEDFSSFGVVSISAGSLSDQEGVDAVFGLTRGASSRGVVSISSGSPKRPAPNEAGVCDTGASSGAGG